MNQISRLSQTALSFCLTVILAAHCFAQQAGVPQAYPQTPYPQTATPNATVPQQTVPQQVAPQQQQLAQPQVGNGQPPIGQAQPGALPQPGAAQIAPVPNMPPGFPLNQLQQAQLNQVLDAWQQESGKVATFTCPFERLEYVMAFSPVINNQIAPLNKNKGELSYSKPDKGSFEIKEIKTYKVLPAPAGQQQPAVQQGDWVKQPEAIGEHWVSDGTAVYEFRSDLNPKQVIERPLPPRVPGQEVLDGPLPFIFGANAEKLKQRYWMKLDDRNPSPNNEIWLIAWPRYQQQAADFSQVDLILDKQRLLPKAMRVTLPNKDAHVYVFHLDQASVNNPLSRIQQTLFEKPRIPWGWKHVVENGQVPVAEGPQGAEQLKQR
jgi:TIGR03009 family protein